MSLRKEVFQAKVLQRLYPAAREVEKVLETPVHHPQGVQLKPSKVTGHVGVPAVSGRKVYTVLPPPKDYVPASGDGLWSPTDAQLVNNADEMPADLSGSEDRDADEDAGRASIKRKRRRKRKAATVSEGDTPSAAEDAEERSKGNAEGSECLSKNKRRKMKKKRHKEKLLALGLVPRSTAVEFTYKESEEKEEEEDGDKKVEEILDFLHSTRDLYLSDRSRGTGDPSVFLSATESLSARLSDGTSPPAVLSVLCRLGALLRRREAEKLHTVLQEFTHTSTLPKDETEVICTLFHYWMTEVLPVQTDQLT
ncbi:glutamate-rich protein 1 isoform X2 [Ictalurus punctatus]|uniref:Glutamate-rich protein 1 isoform X2 n=1 Tax=Ictalurus punctatus TaxID=7998 RepID=A0A2D0RR28_ICTPU|nr:glutamate-rich protein 1 isoform X2 [Ictalurus punctatus]